jgi:hypothetical protein
MTKVNEKSPTYYLIGNGETLQVSLPEFEITTQKTMKTPERQLIFDKSGNEVGMRVLDIVGSGNVRYTDANGKTITEKNADLATARIGKRETLVPVFLLKEHTKLAWIEEGDTRIPMSRIQRTAEHCESLYQERSQAASVQD